MVNVVCSILHHVVRLATLAGNIAPLLHMYE